MFQLGTELDVSKKILCSRGRGVSIHQMGVSFYEDP